MSVGMHVKTQLAERKWENAEFPIVCEGCLGENPYVRMLIDRYSGSCKMCEKPFSIFKWRPGRGEGYKKTEVCQACARTKNLCQTCLLDMQLGLPSQLRDAVLQHVEGALAVPVSDINQSYVTQQQLALLDDEGGMMGEAANEKLIQIARNIHKNREQPRVKMFPTSKPQVSTMASAEDSQTSNKRSASEAELDNGITPLPPGITSLEQLSQVMNLDRLPAAMKSFILQQYGGSVIGEEKSAKEEKSVEESTKKDEILPNKDEVGISVKKASKPKYAPKPPSGPPPESALKASKA